MKRRLLGLACAVSAAGCGDVEIHCSAGVSCEGDVHVATWWFDVMTRDPAFLMPLQTSLERGATLTLDHQAVKSKHCYLRQVWAAMGRAEPSAMPSSAACGDGLLDSAPIDAVLFNNGQDVLALTECGGKGSRGLRALESEFRDDWFEKMYPPDLVSTLSCGGHVYALPIGIHRINHVVYNRSLFERAGYGSPGDLDLDGLVEAADKIQQVFASDGISQPSVFAVPYADADTVSRFFIENIMLAASGYQEYVNYWTGRPVPDGLFAHALDRVRQLSSYFRDASDAPVTRLLNGEAAMLVTGDWAMVDALGAEDVLGSMPFPGTQQYWVYSADVFALPINGNEAKGLAWLQAISEPQAQSDFANLKYALPALLDVAPRHGSEDPRSGTALVRALPALLQGYGTFDELGQQLADWARSSFGDSSAVESYAAAERQKLVERRGSPAVDQAPRLLPQVAEP
ncbi:MAG TPA: ABC transporter substrate-binding protein [Polyangiaceae bacterium]|nr:ABC transporter substrate-binding protein [Polyangiaceae bacterium]